MAKLLADAYGSVYEALGQPSNGYAADGNISAHVKHTPAQARPPPPPPPPPA